MPFALPPTRPERQTQSALPGGSSTSTQFREGGATAKRTSLSSQQSALMGAGVGRGCTGVASLIDTSILVYRFDPRFPDKQRIATRLLRAGISRDTIRASHQAILELVAATTPKKSDGTLLFDPDTTRRPTACWVDAYSWAYAEYYGLEEMVSEDFERDRLQGSVRARNPPLCLIDLVRDFTWRLLSCGLAPSAHPCRQKEPPLPQFSKLGDIAAVTRFLPDRLL